MKKLSFIGAGNMGKAILSGVLKSGITSSENITVYNVNRNSLETVKNEFNVNITTEMKEAVEFADIVIFAVRPNIIPETFLKAKDFLNSDQIVVSIALAISVQSMEKLLGEDKKIIRAMPNTPAMVGEGMTAISKNENIDDDDLNTVLEIFNSFGKAELVPESLMDAVTGVSGSGPAYVFIFIEAMADTAVLYGMPRSQAYKFAAQTVLGAAKMVLETGRHPGDLKDMVCSPGGSTIVAVEKLEECGMRSAVMKGQMACTDKSIALSKK